MGLTWLTKGIGTCSLYFGTAVLSSDLSLPHGLHQGSGPVMNLLEFAPVVDGDFIPDHPSRLFNNTADIDYLAGVNSMDGHLFAGVDVPSINQRKKETTA